MLLRNDTGLYREYFTFVSMQLIRDAFVQSLAKFTKLTTSTGFIEMQPKHIEVIKTILSVAYTDGNYLQSAWLHVSGAWEVNTMFNIIVIIMFNHLSTVFCVCVYCFSACIV